MRYPNVYEYDSDYDYYLACINYCPEAVQAHYDKRKKTAIKALEELDDQLIELAEEFTFRSDFESELNQHLDAIQKLLDNAEPKKCIDL